MNSYYILQFIRRDLKPAENYFYHSFEEALQHLQLFQSDDSNLYERIVIFSSADPSTICEELRFEDN